MIFKKVSLIILLLFISCNSSKPFLSSSNLNTVVNEEYEYSTGTFYGNLEGEVYEKIRREIELELSAKIPEENAIVIHFRQNARNCTAMNNNGKNYFKRLKNGAKISTKITSRNQASDFFVFAKDAFFLKQIELESNYVLDSGFFYDDVFNTHENCSAFFILKPNGKFVKHYGADYYSLITHFLEFVD